MGSSNTLDENTFIGGFLSGINPKNNKHQFEMGNYFF